MLERIHSPWNKIKKEKRKEEESSKLRSEINIIMDEAWLSYLKENEPELYLQAKACIQKLKIELEEKQIVIDRYQNLIACNGFFEVR